MPWRVHWSRRDPGTDGTRKPSGVSANGRRAPPAPTRLAIPRPALASGTLRRETRLARPSKTQRPLREREREHGRARAQGKKQASRPQAMKQRTSRFMNQQASQRPRKRRWRLLLPGPDPEARGGPAFVRRRASPRARAGPSFARIRGRFPTVSDRAPAAMTRLAEGSVRQSGLGSPRFVRNERSGQVPVGVLDPVGGGTCLKPRVAMWRRGRAR